jgi:hypothetical protein
MAKLRADFRSDLWAMARNTWPRRGPEVLQISNDDVLISFLIHCDGDRRFDHERYGVPMISGAPLNLKSRRSTVSPTHGSRLHCR